MNENRYRLVSDQVRRFLPHRAPFLLVDRILEIRLSEVASQLGDLSAHILSSDDKVGTRVVGLKNVTYNEPFFPGHFPQSAIMPGVLVVEAMAQVSSFSLYPYLEKNLDQLANEFMCILVGVDETRFRKPVVPGDTLVIETVVSKCRGRLWAFKCEAKVDGKLVAEASILANLISKGAPS